MRDILSGGNGILGLIILILDIIAIVEVLKSGKDTGHKILWVLVIALFPIIGLILYYLLGRNRSPMKV